MSKTMKGVFLSSFIFPGAGHLFLKSYRRGAVLLVTSLVCLSFLLASAVQQALTIVEQVKLESEVINQQMLFEMVAQASNNTGSSLLNISTLLIIVVWSIGVIDSYRIGKQQDKQSLQD